jgi:hypothetical protein
LRAQIAAIFIHYQVKSWQLFGTSGRLGPVDGHHVPEVSGDGPPHLTLVHDLLLRSNLEIKRVVLEDPSRQILWPAANVIKLSPFITDDEA